jgi:hypothetical protein
VEEERCYVRSLYAVDIHGIRRKRSQGGRYDRCRNGHKRDCGSAGRYLREEGTTDLEKGERAGVEYGGRLRDLAVTRDLDSYLLVSAVGMI